MGVFIGILIFLVIIFFIAAKSSNEKVPLLENKLQNEKDTCLSKEKNYQDKISKLQSDIYAYQELAIGYRKQFESLKFRLELNPEMAKALKLIEENKNVFIHGKAGTGKSWFIKNVLKKIFTNTAYLSFTNIAAINIEGQTIHKFIDTTPSLINLPIFRWPEDRRLEALFNVKKTERIVIDEISMIRAP
jgi:Cdc6-like AAA superfamily ATPase